jgi:hypothetical protein
MSSPLPLAEIARIADYLADLCGDDEQLFTDMIAGETDLARIVQRLHDRVAADEEMLAGIRERQDNLAERRSRLDARVRSYKDAIGMALNAAQLKKLELPEATYSVRGGKPTLKIVDPEGVPMSLCEPRFVPVKAKINEAYQDTEVLPNWLIRVPATPIITSRRK